MPNTPSLVQEGATVFAKGRHCSPDDGLLAQNIFHAVGPTCFEVSESWIDAITGISGSGPAYMYIIIGKYVYVILREIIFTNFLLKLISRKYSRSVVKMKSNVIMV